MEYICRGAWRAGEPGGRENRPHCARGRELAGLLLGFSRCGWTDAARAYQQETQSHPPAGKNWTVTDLRLLDLEQVDDALREWTTALDLPGVEPAL